MNLLKSIVPVLCLVVCAFAQQTAGNRILAGYILTQHNERLPNVTIIVRSSTSELRTASDEEGKFRLAVPDGPLTVRFEGQNITPFEQNFGPNNRIDNLNIRITVVIAPGSRPA